MTLESSTTKHVFIAPSPLTHSADHPADTHRTRRSGSLRGRLHIEQPGDIENDEKLLIETMDAGSDPRQPRIEIDRNRFASVVAQLENLADRIDHEAIGFPVAI